jgi:hypothetical protein
MTSKKVRTKKSLVKKAASKKLLVKKAGITKAVKQKAKKPVPKRIAQPRNKYVWSLGDIIAIVESRPPHPDSSARALS